MLLSNMCIASQEWVEINLGIQGESETAFFNMRDTYHIDIIDKKLEDTLGDYSPKTEKLGSVNYAVFTDFYEGTGGILSSPTYPDPTESLDIQSKIGYCEAPHTFDTIQEDRSKVCEQTCSNNGQTDSRIKVADVSLWPYRITCFLSMRMKDEGNISQNMGTGFLVGPSHILTACHNYHLWVSQSKKSIAQRIGCFPLHYVEGSRDISIETLLSNGYPYSASVCKVYLKKKYTESPEHLGDDLALFVLDKPIGLQLGWGGMAALCNKDFIRNALINIHGYPRDSKKDDLKCKNRMYGMNGVVGDLHQSQSILYNNIDATGGQSGSGVWLRTSSNPGILSFKGPYAIGVHTGPGRVNRFENRAVILQKEDVDFISRTIRSHLLKPNIIDYLRSEDGGWNQEKVGNFMIKIGDEAVNNLESCLSNYKKFVFYNALFGQNIEDIQDKNAKKNLDLLCKDVFLNSIKNLSQEAQEYDNLSEAILLILMRKKIVGDEHVSSSVAFSSNKTTSFLKKIRISINKTKINENLSKSKVLDLSVEKLNAAICSNLKLSPDVKFSLFSINNILFGELALLIKTVGLSFGWSTLVLYGHQFEPDPEDIKIFREKKIEIYMENNN